MPADSYQRLNSYEHNAGTTGNASRHLPLIAASSQPVSATLGTSAFVHSICAACSRQLPPPLDWSSTQHSKRSALSSSLRVMRAPSTASAARTQPISQSCESTQHSKRTARSSSLSVMRSKVCIAGPGPACATEEMEPARGRQCGEDANRAAELRLLGSPALAARLLLGGAAAAPPNATLILLPLINLPATCPPA